MKTTIRFLVLTSVVSALFTSLLHAQTTAFTYQGQLTDNGSPANGLYDLRFELYDADTLGTSIGVVTNAATGISNGLFTVTLDFGAGVFDGDDRWLEIGAVTNGGGAFSTLAPRQPITSTPYAVRAANSASAQAVSGTVDASQLTGTISSNNIGAGSITSVLLADGAVGGDQLANEAVSLEKLTLAIESQPQLLLVITNPEPALDDEFSVSIFTGASTLASLGGQRLVVGVPGKDVANTNDGKVYIFDRNGGLVNELTNPIPRILPFSELFGESLAAVSLDQFLVGEPSSEDPGATGDSGRAFLYDVDGTIITSFTNPAGNVPFDRFGHAMAVFGTNQVVISAPGEFDRTPGGGRVYKMDLEGNTLLTYTNPTASSNALFGSTVTAVGEDTVLVGTDRRFSNGPDEVLGYLYDLQGNPLTLFTNPAPEAPGPGTVRDTAATPEYVFWGASGTTNGGEVFMFDVSGLLLRTFTAPQPQPSDRFGDQVEVLGTDRLLISAPGRNDGDLSLSGEVFLFDFNGNLLASVASPLSDNSPLPKFSQFFGSSMVALDSETAVICQPGADVGAANAGVAYVYSIRSYVPGLAGEGVVRDSVLTESLRDGVVTTEKLAVGSITTATLVDGAVTSEKIGGVLSPSQIPGLDASKITTGTLDNGRLAGTYSSALTLDNAANSLSGNGSGLTSLNASELSSGTVGSARISGNYNNSVTMGNSANVFSGRFQGNATALASAPPFTWIGDTDSGLFRSGANTVALATGGTERMRITSSGNVGIGTSAPEGDLHVRGDSTLGSLIVTPGVQNASAQVLLTENTSASLGGIVRYDGTANEIQVLGWSSDVATAPHLVVGRDNGRVGVGRTPAGNQLEVEGTASKTTSGSWLANSDRRIKREVEPVTDALDTLERVKLVSFRYTDDYRSVHPSVEDRRYLNVVAQQFGEVFPEHVKASGEKLADGSEILQVDTHPLMIYSAAAVQELNRKLTRENAQIRSELQQLRALVESLAEEKGEL